MNTSCFCRSLIVNLNIITAWTVDNHMFDLQVCKYLIFHCLQEILVDRTVHAAVCRFLPSNAAIYEHESPALLREDFSQAMLDFLPVAMRDITKSASDDGRSGWDDVGGLVDIRNAIKEV